MITYQQFKEWCEKHKALKGFMLTGLLIKQLFSVMDPHKKGHLTQNDWINLFSKYDWKN